MNFALVNPQHKNVSNPDRQMMSARIKITILHVERNCIPVGIHKQCHNTSCCMHTSVKLKMLGNTRKQLKYYWYVFRIIKVNYFKNKIQL